MYAVNIGPVAERRRTSEDAPTKAQEELEAFPEASARPSKEGANRRLKLYRRNEAQAAAATEKFQGAGPRSPGVPPVDPKRHVARHDLLRLPKPHGSSPRHG